MPDKWVIMDWFLFGVHPYKPTLDFEFFILKWAIVKHIHQEKRASKRLREAIKL